MKKFILKSSLLAILTIALISCSNNDDGGTQTVTPFTATINGQQYLPTSIPGAIMSNSGRFILINAINTVTDETITLSIGDANGSDPELAVGTYAVTGGGTAISYFVNNSSYITDTSGQITITSLDAGTGKISGTFQGTVAGSFGSTGTFTLSNGEFTDITFSIQ